MSNYSAKWANMVLQTAFARSHSKGVTMRINTALNKRDRAISACRNMWGSAAMFGWHHTRILEKRAEIKADLGKCPQWVKAYVDGYEQALADAARRDLVFGYEVPDGQIVTIDSTRSDHYEKHGYGPADTYSQCVESGYYWATTIALMPFTTKKR